MMTRRLFFLQAMGTVVFFLCAVSFAEVPHMINYQGKLTMGSSSCLNDTVQMTFSVYPDTTGSPADWTETQMQVIIRDGIFNVLLGSENPIPASVFDGSIKYLGVQVESDPEMKPLKSMVSVAYAYKSLEADTADYARAGVGGVDNDWTFRITDTADTTLITGGEWGIARSGNLLYGNADSTHVNFGVACTTGTSGQNYKYCTVVGGWGNTASSDYAVIGGGTHNRADGSRATVGGGYDNTASDFAATVGGGGSNTADNSNATVGGGYQNIASGSTATVAGGAANSGGGDNATVAGGDHNSASGYRATVGGGGHNTVSGNQAAVGGGYENTASGGLATIGGGGGNTASSSYSTVGGGEVNRASGYSSTIGGGRHNVVEGSYSAILGGYADTVTATANVSYLFGIGSKLTQDSTFMVDMPHIRFGNEAEGYEFPTCDGSNGQVMATDGSGQLSWVDVSGGGWSDDGTVVRLKTSTDYVGIGTTTPNAKLDVVGDVLVSGKASIGPGHANTGMHAFVAGSNNRVRGDYSVVSGGGGGSESDSNSALGDYSVVGGGRANIASTWGTAVGGGYSNIASGIFATVGGGTYNKARGDFSVINGGGGFTPNDSNSTLGEYCAIGGGQGNTADSSHATIGGGYRNITTRSYTTIGGGYENTASGFAATVSGGSYNKAQGLYSVVSGGGGSQAYDSNLASGDYSAIGGGNRSIASGNWSTIPGGRENNASGNYSFAAGRRAKANHTGTFVWADSTDENFTSTGSNQFLIRASGGVGIGTTSPSAELHVHALQPRIRLTNNNTGMGENDGIQLSCQSGGSLDAILYNRENGFLEFGTNDTGRIRITANGDIGIGTTSPSVKVEVSANSSEAKLASGRYGVRGAVWPTGSLDYRGVDGYASGGSGSNLNIGVAGSASGGGTNYGIYGTATQAPGNYAGYFLGNVHVNGALSKAGGAFKIDHPLDPANKYLYHSFVESPDMKNIYDGMVVLDARGEAWVELPEWFEALNRDFRYQLTCIGDFAPVYVASKISDNRFRIAGGEPGMEVSWQVTGIRHDKFAQANRIQVEVDKPAKERGKYLHPEAYGLGEEYDIHYEQHKRMEIEREGEKIQ